MLRSMTTFARLADAGDGWSVVMELRSVNSRFFDARIRLPRELAAIEDRIKKSIKERLGRGRVEFSLHYESEEDIQVAFIPRVDLAKNYMAAVKELSIAIGNPPTLDTRDILMLLKDVIAAREEDVDQEKIWENIRPFLDRLLDSAMEMARQEGAATEKDIRQRLDRIRELTSSISRLAGENFNRQAEAMKTRIAALMKDIPMDDSRIAQEAAMLADRLDINEEIVRLNSHLDQFDKYLDMSEDVGRKLDFLVQEIFREANTMASKSADTKISHLVVEIKAELEKIREQLQNVV